MAAAPVPAGLAAEMDHIKEAQVNAGRDHTFMQVLVQVVFLFYKRSDVVENGPQTQ